MSTTQVCRKCGGDKPLDEFKPSKKHKSGHGTACRVCENAYMRDYRNGLLTPRAAGLRKRVEKFFTDNPEEELTFELLLEKFAAKKWHVRAVLVESQRSGLLECVRVIRLRTAGMAHERKE